MHRCVLASQNEYFRTMFTANLTNTDQKKFELPVIAIDILKELINSCYTGKISLNQENIQGLLLAANQYRFTGVVTKCSEYLKTLLTPANCCGIFLFARCCQLKALSVISSEYIAEYFVIVYNAIEFKQLSIEGLLEIFSRNDLNVETEEEIFRAMLCWIDGDEEQRKQHFPKLLKWLKLTQLDVKVSRNSVNYVHNMQSITIIENLAPL